MDDAQSHLPWHEAACLVAGEASGQPSVALTASERLARVGLVFQFPWGRSFLASTLQEVKPLVVPSSHHLQSREFAHGCPGTPALAVSG